MLVVDDDPTVAEIVAGYLDRAGFAVDRAADGPTAVAMASTVRPDLVVLDLMLPGLDGLEVCRRIREQHREGGPVPVVMLTARGEEDDRILGLEVGADDYVTKPFSPRELVLRVESVLRRAGTPAAPGPWLRSGPLALDPAARRATRNGVELQLTIREFDLLAFFLRHPGRVVGREELMHRVWGWEFGDLSTVTVHVRRLREKIEDDPARPRLITTVWGVGYRFDPPAAPDAGVAGDDAEGGSRRHAGGPTEGAANAGHRSRSAHTNGSRPVHRRRESPRRDGKRDGGCAGNRNGDASREGGAKADSAHDRDRDRDRHRTIAWDKGADRTRERTIAADAGGDRGRANAGDRDWANAGDEGGDGRRREGRVADRRRTREEDRRENRVGDRRENRVADPRESREGDGHG